MKPVLLINPNSSEKTTNSMTLIARRYLPDVLGWTNKKGPKMIVDANEFREAADKIARAKWPNVSAMIIAAFGDPGAERLCRKLDIPVIGIGAASARVAALDNVSFAVVTTTPKLTSIINPLMQKNGGNAYLGCYLTEGNPLFLASNPEALDESLIKACEVAKCAGADRVIIGGGPLGEAAIRISTKVTVPLIQPLAVACSEVLSAM